MVEKSAKMKGKSLLDAAHARDLVALSAAIARGDKLEKRSPNGWTALGAACEVSFPKGVELLIKAGANVDASNIEGCCPVAMACSQNSPECVELLVKAGADVNAKDGYGMTAAMRAARPKRERCLSMLLGAGADVKVRNAKDRGAASYATQYGADKALAMLIEAGVPFDERDASGRTLALEAAGSQGVNMGCIQVLAESGADLDARGKCGSTAGEILRRRGKTELADYVEAMARAKAEARALLAACPEPDELPARKSLRM